MSKQAKAVDPSLEPADPSLEEWRQLYEAAIRVKEMAPWDWMDEQEIFGVQNPETGELGFVSLMGMARVYFAVALYRGAEGLYGYWEIQVNPALRTPERMLEIPQLQASFENRKMLEKQDRDVIKKLGLKFSGADLWPQFRSYSPGYFPWFLTGEEARFLTHALTQTLDVAPRVRKDRKLLRGGKNQETEYLVRVPHKVDDRIDWTDQVMSIEPPEPVPVTFTWDKGVLDQLKKLPLRNATFDLDLQMIPFPIGEKGKRLYMAYALLLVESRIGVVVQFEIMEPMIAKHEVWALVPARLSEWLIELDGVPTELRVKSRMLHGMLGPLAKKLRFQLKLEDSLPVVDELMCSMDTWMKAGKR